MQIEKLRRRYTDLNGARPACPALLANMECTLGVKLPADFRQICDFFDGGGLHILPLFSLGADAVVLNPLQETLRLRVAIDLPPNYLVLGEPAESLLIMSCSANSSPVLWLDAIDAENLGSHRLMHNPDVWDCFADFFAYLLDEEEAERA